MVCMTPTTEELQAVLLHADYMEPISEALARNIRLLAQAELSRREVKPAKCVCTGNTPICMRYTKSVRCIYCGHDRACHGGESD